LALGCPCMQSPLSGRDCVSLIRFPSSRALSGLGEQRQDADDVFVL
jgi:hypothetical protein